MNRIKYIRARVCVCVFSSRIRIVRDRIASVTNGLVSKTVSILDVRFLNTYYELWCAIDEIYIIYFQTERTGNDVRERLLISTFGLILCQMFARIYNTYTVRRVKYHVLGSTIRPSPGQLLFENSLSNVIRLIKTARRNRFWRGWRGIRRVLVYPQRVPENRSKVIFDGYAAIY